MVRVKKFLLAAVLILSAFSQMVSAGVQVLADNHDYHSDKEAIYSLVTGYFDAQSGPVGVAATGEELAAYFHPQGVVWYFSKGNALIHYVAEGTEAHAKRLLKSDFYEKALTSSIHVYGELAHAFVTYEITGGGKPPKRGIDSIQLAKINNEWKMISMFYTGEIEGQPVEELGF